MVRKIFFIIMVAVGFVGFSLPVYSQAVNSLDEDSSLSPVSVNAVVAPVKKEVAPKSPEDLYSQVELFSYALTKIMSEYVDEKKPKEVIYGALTGMLGALDPHSQFLSPEDYDELKSDTEGKFGGLGIEIAIRDNLLTVISPIEGTPAWKAGIKAGDRIVKIEKDTTRDITISQAVKKLRGNPGTKVHITIMRESEFKIHEYDITREIIHIQDIRDPHIISDNIAYLRLVEFREESTEQMLKELRKLKEQGATALVLDVRNNPGGLLSVAIRISEIFLPDGKTIVSVRGRDASQNTVSVSHNSSHEFSEWPIVIMINEGSASGSEILAGALKDNKRAVTLGSKSFGKGSVQSVIPLPDGSGLRLTTSKYFTPSGVCIHEIGITPDIVVERIVQPEENPDDADGVKSKALKTLQKEDSVNKIFDALAPDDANDPNAIEKRRREKEMNQQMKNDNQIQSAISVIKGIRVYKKLTSTEN